MALPPEKVSEQPDGGRFRDGDQVLGIRGGQMFRFTRSVAGCLAFEEDNALVTAITQNVYAPINCNLSLNQTDGFTVSGSTLTYTLPELQNAVLWWRFSARRAMAGADNFAFKVEHEGVPLAGRCAMELTNGTELRPGSLFVFVHSLAQNDELEMMITNLNGDDDAIVVDQSVLVIAD